MSSYTIYHNPLCSKSRQALGLLEENNIKPEIRLYLKDPLSEDELIKVLDILNLKPIDICRTKETIFKELGLSKDSSDSEILEAISKHPVLLERAIITKNNEFGVLGRPPENVLKLL